MPAADTTSSTTKSEFALVTPARDALVQAVEALNFDQLQRGLSAIEDPKHVVWDLLMNLLEQDEVISDIKRREARLSCARVLIDFGGRIPNTPYLMTLAVFTKHLDLVKLLVQHGGADPNYAGEEDDLVVPATQVAAANGYQHILEFLLGLAGANFENVLVSAIGGKHYQLAHRLLRKYDQIRANVNEVDEHGRSALACVVSASCNGQEVLSSSEKQELREELQGMVKALLDQNADPNRVLPDTTCTSSDEDEEYKTPTTRAYHEVVSAQQRGQSSKLSHAQRVLGRLLLAGGDMPQHLSPVYNTVGKKRSQPPVAELPNPKKHKQGSI